MGLLDWLQDPRRTQAMQGIGSAIQSGLLNIQQGNERFQGLASRALADPTNPAKVTDPQAFNELSKMAMGLLSFAPVGMTVFHGSPAKFQKFDPTKIGSGEGAQSYGYGHYVAESPEVAKDYQRRLAKEAQATDLNTKMQMVDVGGKPLTSFNVDMDASLLDAAKAGKKEFVNLAESKKARWESLSQDQSYPFQDYAKQKVGAYNSLLDAAKKSDVDYTGTGTFYKIDLPDEQIAKMLDWDKPLSEQPLIMDFINRQEAARTKSVLDQRLQTLKNLDENSPNAATLKRQIEILREEISNPQASGLGSMTGGEYYNYLRRRDMPPDKQAEMFRNAGIPGIRYLDQGSRGTGQGTSNFVVFPGNEDLLRILERNNQPLSLLD